ncbi:DUF3156 family protein [Pseudomonas sp. LRF_L74]|uniref:DUF3156 family protein n=1 Tax=Pseudomonas sp. LRF_L74 TaxID=3369422 RepID=UPI003F604156
MLRKLSELFGQQRAPSGYRPGVTLDHVRRNLGDLRFEALESGRGRFVALGGTLQFEVHERTQSELLMHLVLTDFVLDVPACKTGRASLELRHSGAIKRSGIVVQRPTGDVTALQAALIADQDLSESLMPLDFKRLRIERDDDHWQVRLEHMAASEVVNRMPSFRRYIRLNEQQRDCLLAALNHLQRILRAH